MNLEAIKNLAYETITESDFNNLVENELVELYMCAGDALSCNGEKMIKYSIKTVDDEAIQIFVKDRNNY